MIKGGGKYANLGTAEKFSVYRVLKSVVSGLSQVEDRCFWTSFFKNEFWKDLL